MNRPHRLAIALVAVLAATALSTQPVSADSPAGAPQFHDGDGLSLVSATATGDRTWHLVVATQQLSKPVRIDVLLPQGYAGTTNRYPVLYLFHGTNGGADDWLDQGNAAAATASYPLIVVMPDAGYDNDGGSWFTNWVDQKTPLGVANWETFHIDQMVPWIDANLRTITSRDGRAIAGLSQGGFGAFSYAAQYPDLFADAGSFSGAPDIASNPVVQSAALGVIGGTAVAYDKVEPNAMFGDPVTNDINWQGHNPANLVTNLADTTLDLWSGNGVPGPLDTSKTASDGAIEAIVHPSAVSFAHLATTHHIAYHYDYYGAGTHSWPYWTRDLVQYLPRLMNTLDHPAGAPSTISYRSVAKTWTQWDWTVANTRKPVQAWSGLASASPSGFVLASGTPAAVTTPAVYQPGTRYRLVTTGGTGPAQVVASSTGRLTVSLTPNPGSGTVRVSIVGG
ncbi:MAG: hypothetical protein JWP74_1866 [Marmoricola sp.]|nr:hypothetical protein [Marmoricola sp.]